MGLHYNQKYDREHITIVLQTIHGCVREGQYIVSKNEKRLENIVFVNEYNLTSNKQKAILLNIVPDDFCHTLQNTKPGYEHEVLYVFCPQARLVCFEGNEEEVDVYIKVNIIDTYEGKRVVVISFHKPNKPIDY